MSKGEQSNKAEQKPTTIIVLGASGKFFSSFLRSGDLAHKKTFPALFSLFSSGRLPEKSVIIGYAR